MVILEVRTESGTVRRCDATCHNATGKKCNCVCNGAFHGTDSSRDHLVIPWGQIEDVRENLALEHGESVQLRVGA